MSGLQTATEALGTRTAADIMALYDRVDDVITYDDFLRSAPLIIATANRQGVQLAHLSLNSLLLSLGREALVIGSVTLLDHYLDHRRLERALRTATEVPEQSLMRLERIARAEPVEATQRSFSDLIKRTPAVSGWTRVLEPDACEMCNWWDRDGRVWPADHAMPTHKGCTCTQRPVLSRGTLTTSADAKRASAARDAYGDVDTRRLVDPSEYSRRSINYQKEN